MRDGSVTLFRGGGVLLRNDDLPASNRKAERLTRLRWLPPPRFLIVVEKKYPSAPLLRGFDHSIATVSVRAWVMRRRSSGFSSICSPIFPALTMIVPSFRQEASTTVA